MTGRGFIHDDLHEQTLCPDSLSLHVTGYAAICPYALSCYITALGEKKSSCLCLFLRPREAIKYRHISEFLRQIQTVRKARQ